jgi:hypothetical protein
MNQKARVIDDLQVNATPNTPEKDKTNAEAITDELQQDEDLDLSNSQERQGVEVPEEIVQQLIKDEYIGEDLEKCLETKGGVAGNLKAEHLELNDDKEPEISVRTSSICVCSSKNCTEWVYHKTANGYDLLLKANGSIRPKKTLTNGYRDLEVEEYGAPGLVGLYVYKFNGKRYRVAKCSTADYAYRDKNGDAISERKRPKITPTECDYTE